MDNELKTGGNVPLSRAEQDREDLQNEVAGRETGRPKRFLSPEARGPESREGQKRKRDREFTLHMLLAANPQYAALYEQISNKLDGAKTAAEYALAHVNAVINQTEAELEDMRDRASMLPDGTKVFRSKDGHVYTEDGRSLTAKELAEVEWKDDAPSYEAFLATREAYDHAIKDRDAIHDYQRNVLDPAEERLTDEDNPPSTDELEKIGKNIDDKMPDIVRASIDPIVSEKMSVSEVPTSNPAIQSDDKSEGLNSPDMNGSFQTASDPLAVADLDLPPDPTPSLPGAKR